MIAVIIPAYKEAYLREALDSLVNQTCGNFRVYVGDDNSPFDLKPIVDSYQGKLSIKYKKFENNIGSKEIVRQWQRCVALSEDEKWLWLFSDDDIADRKGVENFYSVASDKFDVYRFNTCVIDADSKIQAYTPVGPMQESSASMAYNLLLGKRGNSMPDHIFSRKIYEEKGFVYTKYAQAADWATSISFSQDKGIQIIPDSKLYWRLSGTNISSVAATNKRMMIEGHLQFIEWIARHFKGITLEGDITYNMILRAARENAVNILITHYKGIDNNNTYKYIKILKKCLNVSLIGILRDVYRIKRATDSRINKPILFLQKLLRRP